MTIFRLNSEFLIRRISSPFSCTIYLYLYTIPINDLFFRFLFECKSSRWTCCICHIWFILRRILDYVFLYFVLKRRRNYKRMGLLMCSTTDSNTTSEVDTKGCEILWERKKENRWVSDIPLLVNVLLNILHFFTECCNSRILIARNYYYKCLSSLLSHFYDFSSSSLLLFTTITYLSLLYNGFVLFFCWIRWDILLRNPTHEMYLCCIACISSSVANLA